MKRYAFIIGSLLGLVCLMGFAVALNPLNDNDKFLDPDNDELTNLEEFVAGSDPNNWDSDGDGLPDGWEVDTKLNPTDPEDAHIDNDYFEGEQYAAYSVVPPPYDNYAEYYRLAYIDPENGEKVFIHTNPNNPDTDGDTIYDPDDQYPNNFRNDGTSGGGGGPVTGEGGEPVPPDNTDTDGDGIPDAKEYYYGTDYLNPDTDGDGLSDLGEIQRGLDPNDWDTDNDMLIDGVEAGNADSTDGHMTDTDNDGVY